MRHLLTEKVLTRWLVLCPSWKWRPGLRCPRAGDMKARKQAARLRRTRPWKCGNSRMLAAPEAEGAAEHKTQWREAFCSRCQGHSFPKTPASCCRWWGESASRGPREISRASREGADQQGEGQGEGPPEARPTRPASAP